MSGGTTIDPAWHAVGGRWSSFIMTGFRRRERMPRVAPVPDAAADPAVAEPTDDAVRRAVGMGKVPIRMTIQIESNGMTTCALVVRRCHAADQWFLPWARHDDVVRKPPRFGGSIRSGRRVRRPPGAEPYAWVRVLVAPGEQYP